MPCSLRARLSSPRPRAHLPRRRPRTRARPRSRPPLWPAHPPRQAPPLRKRCFARTRTCVLHAAGSPAAPPAGTPAAKPPAATPPPRNVLHAVPPAAGALPCPHVPGHCSHVRRPAFAAGRPCACTAPPAAAHTCPKRPVTSAPASPPVRHSTTAASSRSATKVTPRRSPAATAAFHRPTALLVL
ncbi:uncharacterized protein DKFZp434B061-like [Panicum virgatum]|uniref:uncharacterized protein DKFZp434B061-like n=1 Tax=Panicum virgatum TaxID=38727 RepID=UPI0019D51C1D|nr:uncharacterized protein DKFZp434B061-like [Panicum virgatum]